MASDRFPYDLPSREAMVRLIQETFPKFGLEKRYAKLGRPFFQPTADIPGRTFIEVENTIKNVKANYVYRRLDLGVTFPNGLEIAVTGPITPRSVAQEINRAYEMQFGPEDVPYFDFMLVPIGISVVYRMRALSDSLVWFGDVLVTVHPADIPSNARLLEDGRVRYLEDGEVRIMEAL